jgi:hypothetical protein
MADAASNRSLTHGLGKSITVEQRLINLDTRLDDGRSPDSGNGVARGPSWGNEAFAPYDVRGRVAANCDLRHHAFPVRPVDLP